MAAALAGQRGAWKSHRKQHEFSDGPYGGGTLSQFNKHI